MENGARSKWPRYLDGPVLLNRSLILVSGIGRASTISNSSSGDSGATDSAAATGISSAAGLVDRRWRSRRNTRRNSRSSRRGSQESIRRSARVPIRRAGIAVPRPCHVIHGSGLEGSRPRKYKLGSSPTESKALSHGSRLNISFHPSNTHRPGTRPRSRLRACGRRARGFLRAGSSMDCGP